MREAKVTVRGPRLRQVRLDVRRGWSSNAPQEADERQRLRAPHRELDGGLKQIAARRDMGDEAFLPACEVMQRAKEQNAPPPG